MTETRNVNATEEAILTSKLTPRETSLLADCRKLLDASTSHAAKLAVLTERDSGYAASRDYDVITAAYLGLVLADMAELTHVIDRLTSA